MPEKHYVMRMCSGYAYSSLKTLENVIVSDDDCKNAKFTGFFTEPSADSKPFCKFRLLGKDRFQLAQYCELTPIRAFYDCDVFGLNTQFPRIYCDRSELIDKPLWYHLQGLSQTSSGYGSKLTNPSCIWFNGRVYRIYTTIYGNGGSSWFKAKKRKIYVD